MTRADVLYMQVNIICFLVFARLLHTVLFDSKNQYESKLFARVLLSAGIFTLSDIGWVLLTKLLFPHSIAASYLVNLIYFIASAFIGFTWFSFCGNVIGLKTKESRLMRAVLCVPFFALLALSLLSPFFHLVFYIDSANIYHRGPFHFLQVACMDIYFLIMGILGIIKFFDKNDLSQRRKYASICGVMLVAFVAQMIQVFIPGYPIIEMGLAFSLLCVFIELRDSIVSLDPLTQIYNRHRFLAYLEQEFKSYRVNGSSRFLYLFVLDVDRFKQINDTYGHLEGDFALQTVADSLKEVAAEHKALVCRYGGDEFMLMCEKADDGEAQELVQALRRHLEAAAAKCGKDYTVSVSAGYAKRDSAAITVTDLIKKADALMYIDKAERRN